MANGTESIVLSTIYLFGADRTMFGSNVPVDSLCAPLTEIIAGFKAILAPLAASDQARFFAGTARRVYRLAEQPLGEAHQGEGSIGLAVRGPL